MLYEAAWWRADTPRPPIEEALREPELVKLLRDWGQREGDTGVIACDDENEAIGAAWYRLWSDNEHSYGYVSPKIPELAIAVHAEHRARGIGGELLNALLRNAAQNGIEQISLSVERDNPAIRLYESHGFQKHSTVGNAWTMIAHTR